MMIEKVMVLNRMINTTGARKARKNARP